MKVKFFSAFLLLTAIHSFAQIKLKQHDFFSVGDTIVEYYNRLPQNPINVGDAGENIVWDFSNLDAIAVKENTLTFLNPRETPFSTDYPDANIALYANEGYEVWMFMKSSRKKLTNLGFGMRANNEKRTGNHGGIDINLPLKYLDKSSNESVSSKVLYKNKNGQDSIKLKTVLNHAYTIDAWGDVILPKGTFLCLRLKYTLNTTNYTYQKQENEWVLLGKPETKSIISYKWWTDDENAKYPVVQVVMDEANEKPLVIHYLEVTPFSEIMDKVKDETIKVYPNPTSEKLFIDIPKAEETYTTIYTITGKIVKNVKAYTSTIKIDVSYLSAGIYLLINRNKSGQIIGKSKFIKK